MEGRKKERKSMREERREGREKNKEDAEKKGTPVIDRQKQSNIHKIGVSEKEN